MCASVCVCLCVRAHMNAKLTSCMFECVRDFASTSVTNLTAALATLERIRCEYFSNDHFMYRVHLPLQTSISELCVFQCHRSLMEIQKYVGQSLRAKSVCDSLRV